ncbi:SDR family oxidoreductase [Amycolatopsis decaplanina]|uniref:Short chain dehydrogenase n=1 Tax=Amycolatopsis decaplanina DSM 44594 TaxID=1284240 RepID=M2XQ99_9PSEU|nr:SDR family oxidoreductase [Amycolatopsis decaplanina]EME51375.1 short chain dehydrogenase [Amycolatopsis decaplanina DSM 44594]
MTSIEGAVVLVTGGQRGLGKAFVAELLDRGAAKVHATARSPREETDPRIVPLPLDVTDPESVRALAAKASDATIVFNNAGVLGLGSLLAGDVDAHRPVFETNVFGALRVAQAFAPQLKDGGALVNVHSVLSWAAGSGSYGASKAAFWSITNSLRIEFAEQGTQVVGVHLGYTDTDMTQGLDIPKNDPRDVARQVVDGLEKGETEVLTDDLTRRVKAALSGPVEHLGTSRIAA